MAAFGTLSTKYTPLYQALCQAGGFISFMNSSVDPDQLKSGKLTARITTAVTLGSITDGTLAANGAARTEVALTIATGTHAISLFPYETGNIGPDDVRQNIIAFQDAMRLLAEQEIVIDLVAGTPGNVQTLANGTMNFTNLDTLAKQCVALGKFMNALTYVEANTQGKGGAICIAFSATSYGNFLALRNESSFKNDFERETVPDPLGGPGRPRWTYLGYPMFVLTETTDFGVASKECCYIIHKDAEALVYQDLYFPADDGGAMGGGLFRDYGDYMQKFCMAGWFYAGLIQASHYASVLNGAT
jgi:hypothetical protein